MAVRAAVMTMLATTLAFAGCAEPEYDLSSPQAAIDAVQQMVADERPDLLVQVVHIECRDITYDDGVTEASAVNDVLEKAGDMLSRLFRVARKLRERFPEEVAAELGAAEQEVRSRGFGEHVAGFVTDPFGMIERNRGRLTALDLGDGTAVLRLDGEPLPVHLNWPLVEIDGRWKLAPPLHLLGDYRPNTRHEWSVIASMMLATERSLIEFEQEVDDGRFRSLRHAGERVGRLLGESVVVQGLIYTSMKRAAMASQDGSGG